MLKSKKDKKKLEKGLLIFVFCLPFIAISAGYLFRLSMTKTCARIIGESNLKNHRTYDIVFKKGDEVVSSVITAETIKYIEIDSLKKIDCLEIEYSNVWYKYVSVVDKKYGTGIEW